MAVGAQVRGWVGASRRRVPRFEMQAPLDVTVLRSGLPDTVPGRSVDVGERGIAAMLAGELVTGETVGVEVRLPLAGALRARAMVRYQDQLRCGLEFVGLSLAQRAAIRDSTKQSTAETGIVVVPAPALDQVEKPTEKLALDEAENEKRQVDAGAIGVAGRAVSGGTISGGGNSVGSGSGGGKTSGGAWSRAWQRMQRPEWAVLLIGFVALAAFVAGVFLWRWNRTWEELESGLRNPETASAEKPQAQVAAEVMQKLLVHRVEPAYPAEARKANVQGVIALDIVVGRDGSVVSMRALNGPDVLARAAMDALRWWKFEPYRVNGEPAAVETTLAVEFKK